ncbi:uncharacterized protein AMSG_08135 [Thecamonas trahens ATCC 50062]|uniref:Guanylate cyclase domain-containing protein n=1 Tax=Thecamonas trahens ATCC 50062 TaxID=461836 RepID=A0A0L0DMG6_THETB|nr:hypothetical protein AMSG_08135 [Thecamonas trahens ATCC 50062]KNC52568.1 hypothetical protein AMSG_08135 [Thecamonas trahens ATCC 50062]|eukprot:XP_013755358.1 hypothetical protein AMSG_08135 [Thecamonas trahens ATCC 50062]
MQPCRRVRRLRLLYLYLSLVVLAMTYVVSPVAGVACTNELHTSANGQVSGTVTHTGGYDNNQVCTYTFDYLHGGVELTWTAFDLESGFDYIRIWGGDTTADPASPSAVLLVTMTDGAESYVGQTMFFDYPQLVVEFDSDDATTGDGFAFTWVRSLSTGASPVTPPPPLATPHCVYAPTGTPSLEISGDKSVEMWVHELDLSYWWSYFDFRTATDQIRVRLVPDAAPDGQSSGALADRALSFSTDISGRIVYEGDPPDGTILTGVDIHLAGTYDDSADMWKIYIDGVQVSAYIAESSPLFGIEASSADAPAGLRFFTSPTGRTWDVRVWDYELSATEIALRRFSTLTGCESGLVGLFRLDGVSDPSNQAQLGCGGSPGAGICKQGYRTPAVTHTTVVHPVTCADGYVEGAEACDDGNTDAGDGCSPTCTLEPGWSCSGLAPSLEPGYACLTPGAPCTTCAHPNGMDCAGTCDGNAILDTCNVCSGGVTSRPPNADRDDCGVCFGENAAKDDCGVCFGANVHKDDCSVCFGTNTTCAGCDGIPNSGLVRDVCGVCDGDGSTCLGCDGIPIPSGGAHFDACGDCGGNATVCYVGCDGVYGSGIHYDCHGVCGGNATVDNCGMCAGGNVSTPLPYNYHLDSCGVCFGQDLTCTTCASGILDACGVCDGDNSTCVGCDGIRVSDGGALFDLCGVCGGDGTSCIMGCDGVLGSSAIYDCVGVCAGSAALDDCNSCTGGTSLIPTANFSRTTVGCASAAMSIATLAASALAATPIDDCGVCFGSNLAKDDCAVCYGNNSACVGCDGIPNSGLVLDPCGECVSPEAQCLGGRAASQASRLTPTLGMAMGGSFMVLCLVLLAALILTYRRRKRASVIAYQATLARKAPQGAVFIMSTDIQDSTMLWETCPEEMIYVLDTHNAIMRGAIENNAGYEFKTEGDAFFAAFATVADALRCCTAAQERLYAATWPDWLLNALPDSDAKLWNGPRVRIGIHYGNVSSTFDARAGRTQYFGGMVNLATLVSDLGFGGQITVSRPVIDALASACAADQATALGSSLSIQVTPLAHVTFDAVAGTVEVWEVLPMALGGRAQEFGMERIERIATTARPVPPEVLEGVLPAVIERGPLMTERGSKTDRDEPSGRGLSASARESSPDLLTKLTLEAAARSDAAPVRTGLSTRTMARREVTTASRSKIVQTAGSAFADTVLGTSSRKARVASLSTHTTRRRNSIRRMRRSPSFRAPSLRSPSLSPSHSVDMLSSSIESASRASTTTRPPPRAGTPMTASLSALTTDLQSAHSSPRRRSCAAAPAPRSRRKLVAHLHARSRSRSAKQTLRRNMTVSDIASASRASHAQSLPVVVEELSLDDSDAVSSTLGNGATSNLECRCSDSSSPSDSSPSTQRPIATQSLFTLSLRPNSNNRSSHG